MEWSLLLRLVNLNIMILQNYEIFSGWTLGDHIFFQSLWIGYLSIKTVKAPFHSPYLHLWRKILKIQLTVFQVAPLMQGSVLGAPEITQTMNLMTRETTCLVSRVPKYSTFNISGIISQWNQEVPAEIFSKINSTTQNTLSSISWKLLTLIFMCWFPVVSSKVEVRQGKK